MKNVKKVTAFVVAFVMMVSMMLTANAAAVFPDVDSNDQYASAISLLKMLQVTTGDQNGRFNPNQTITRAEFSKILYVLMNGSPDVSLYAGKSSFTDVADNAWYNGYVNWASNLNVVSGKGNKKFAPMDPVTTQEATKMFVVALTEKSTLTWPYGFITEASKPNINLYKGAVIRDLSKAAPRNLIAQLCYNAIFATDVSAFNVTSSQGTVIERPSAASAVFGLKNLQTVIFETSKNSWSLTGIKTDNMIAVKNESGDVIQVPYSGAADSAGYSASVYYQDSNRNSKLDTNDSVLSITLGNCTAAIAKPVNILSVNNTYQLAGVTFNPNTDIKTGSRLFVMSPTGVVSSSILTPAALVPYLGALSTDATTTTGIANDYDVKVVKDNTTSTINAVYVTQPVSFARVTSYNQTAGILSLDNALFGTKTITSTGTAPNMTKVTIASGVKIGDYVSAFPSRDYTGVNWTVSPLTVLSGVTLSSIRSDGTPTFGNKVYNKNVQVDEAVATGRLPDSTAALSISSLGKACNIYLDSTGMNYLFVTSTAAATYTENYVFVKAVNTVSTMGTSTYTMTVADTSGTARTYNLNLAVGGDPNAYLTGNAATGCQGWTSADGTYSKIVVLNKVLKLTTNGAGEITRLEGMSGTTSSQLAYDSSTKIFSTNGVTLGVVDESSTVFVWSTSTNTLSVYRVNTLPSFANTTGTYLVSNLKLAVALLNDLGSSTVNQAASTSRGIVLGYSAVAGSAAGRIRYTITAITKGSTQTTLTTGEESLGGAMGTALVSAQGGAKFVDFTYDSNGLVTVITPVSAVAGAEVTSGVAGWHAGTVTATSGGLFAVKGLNIVDSKLQSFVGNAVTYTLASSAYVYTVNATPTSNILIPGNIVGNFAVASSANLLAATPDVAYAVVYHSDANNVIDTAFVFNYILLH